jgi:chloramphenicol O-acetyltransferase type B
MSSTPLTHSYPFIRPIDFYSSQGLCLQGTSTNELRWRIRDERVTVGRGTYGGPTIVLYSRKDAVSIGQYCSIANDVLLLAGGEHNTSVASTFPFRVYFGVDPGALAADPRQIEYADATYKGPITIGNDVWIGFGATVLSGVTIGDGAIVGARAVVAKDVAPYSIVVGNPARIVRSRFPDPIVKALLGIRWWDWKDDVIFNNYDRLLRDPEAILTYFDSLAKDEQRLLYRDATSTAEVPFLHALPKLKPEWYFRSILKDLVPPIFVRLLQKLRHRQG